MFVGASKLEISQDQMLEIIYRWLRDDVFANPIQVLEVKGKPEHHCTTFSITLNPLDDDKRTFVGSASLEINESTMIRAVDHWLQTQALSDQVPRPTVDHVRPMTSSTPHQFSIELNGKFQKAFEGIPKLTAA